MVASGRVGMSVRCQSSRVTGDGRPVKAVNDGTEVWGAAEECGGLVIATRICVSFGVFMSRGRGKQQESIVCLTRVKVQLRLQLLKTLSFETLTLTTRTKRKKTKTVWGEGGGRWEGSSVTSEKRSVKGFGFLHSYKK
ncbi:hypothetical protein NL676_037009 [Syzygium grande]|nr:hypothetical protein NL676_037009 [Syzygium grande]